MRLSSFFTHSFWALTASVGTGVLNLITQSVVMRALKTTDATQDPRFALFTVLMEALGVLAIPATGLQGAFIQMAVRDKESSKPGELAGATWSILKILGAFSIALALGVAVLQSSIVAKYGMGDATALWITVFTVPFALSTFVFTGIIQGQESFRRYGVATLVGGGTRVVAMVLLTRWMGPTTSAAMLATLMGTAAGMATLIAGCQNLRGVEPAPFNPWPFLRSLVPLTLGLGVPTWVISQDIFVVKQFFTEGQDGYAAARVVGKAIIFLTAPLALVLFPRVAQNMLRSQKSNILLQACATTLAIGGLAALSCTFLPALPLQILSGNQYVAFAHYVPMFAWALLPFALFTVLLQSLIARQEWSVVPVVVTLSLLYALALRLHHPTFERIILIMGAFGLLLVAVAWFFCRKADARLDAAQKLADSALPR